MITTDSFHEVVSIKTVFKAINKGTDVKQLAHAPAALLVMTKSEDQ